MNNKFINKKFIEKYKRIYECDEDANKEYYQIIKKVKNEINSNQFISKGLFKDIIYWKSPRLMGIVKFNEFNVYKNIILETIKIKETEKIHRIVSLYGIWVPTGSTILHYIYPNKFPICDVRTLEALKYLGYIDNCHKSCKQYNVFKDILNGLSKDTCRSLRDIDMALFAYHKYVLKKGTKIRHSRCRGK